MRGNPTTAVTRGTTQTDTDNRLRSRTVRHERVSRAKLVLVEGAERRAPLDSRFMNELVAAVAGAMVGAIVGGIIAWLVGGQQIRAAQRENLRLAIANAVNDLWLSADRLWESTQAAAWVVFEIQAQRAANQLPLSPELEPLRRGALAEKETAKAQARHAIARLRLLNVTSDLVSKAEYLMDRSGKFKLSVEDTTDTEDTQARAAALADFEESAGSLLA